MEEIKRRSRRAAEGPASLLAALGVSPNVVTVVGSLLTASTGLLVAQGWFVAGGICFWLFGLTDTLDGAVARATNRVTRFGAFLDSVCDRYAEAAVFVGLVWWYQGVGSQVGVMLALVALIGSLMVSYARARAEGVGWTGEVGWLQRPERMFLLGLGFLLTPISDWILLGVLALLAIFTNVTVLQRVAHAARQASQDQ